MNERKKLLKRVQECDFVLNDTALFLNVNPNNRQALAHYKKYLALRQEAADAYVKKYGPLVRSDYDGSDKWKWVSDPWPWDNTQEV